MKGNVFGVRVFLGWNTGKKRSFVVKGNGFGVIFPEMSHICYER